MRRKVIQLVIAAGMGLGAISVAGAGMFDMMNPSRWFGDRDRDYDRHRYGGYGPYGWGGGPYGWGGGPYGWGGGGPYGWGGGPYGWGGYNPWGYGSRPSTIVVTPPNDAGKASPRVPE